MTKIVFIILLMVCGIVYSASVDQLGQLKNLMRIPRMAPANDRSEGVQFDDLTASAAENFYDDDTVRQKRVHVFRPLFVYREQQIKKKRIKATKPKATEKRPTAQRRAYSQYHPHYYPYQYGPKYTAWDLS